MKYIADGFGAAQPDQPTEIGTRSKKCRYCAYFNTKDETCRVSSPVAFPQNTMGKGAFVTVWPTVKPDDWCGEFMDNGVLNPVDTGP